MKYNLKQKFAALLLMIFGTLMVKGETSAEQNGIVIYVPSFGVRPKVIEYKELHVSKKNGTNVPIIYPDGSKANLVDSLIIDSFDFLQLKKLCNIESAYYQRQAEKITSRLEKNIKLCPPSRPYLEKYLANISNEIKRFESEGPRIRHEEIKLLGINDIQLNDGTILRGCKMESFDGAIVKITHSGGIGNFDIKKLPESKQNELGFEKKKYDEAKRKYLIRKKVAMEGKMSEIVCISEVGDGGALIRIVKIEHISAEYHKEYYWEREYSSLANFGRDSTLKSKLIEDSPPRRETKFSDEVFYIPDLKLSSGQHWQGNLYAIDENVELVIKGGKRYTWATQTRAFVGAYVNRYEAYAAGYADHAEIAVVEEMPDKYVRYKAFFANADSYEKYLEKKPDKYLGE